MSKESKDYYNRLQKEQTRKVDRELDELFKQGGMIVEDTTVSKFLEDKLDRVCDWLAVHLMVIVGFTSGLLLGYLWGFLS